MTIPAVASRKSIDIVSLGCSKNLVDTERLMKLLADAGFDTRFEPSAADDSHAEAVVINTCGFIGDAKEESIEAILSWAEAKKRGRVDKLIVMGCLSERYLNELRTEIPEVDIWRGKHDWADIVTTLARSNPATAPYDRVITTPRHHAYLKVAEGCNRFCSFCAIPLITGRFKSRSIEDILAEANMLASRGVSELNVLAQDLSSYGLDIYRRHALADLTDRLADVEGIRRIRLHYAYPADFPMDVMDVMARRDNVCSYMDIALQHIADPVLANMRRHITGEQTRALLAEMRSRVPDLHIRTTLMVGYPGEGEREFEQLMEFAAEQRFERMGAFAYCEEEGTYGANHHPDVIPDEVKQQRLSRLMALQEEISMENQQAKVGKRLNVVIDREEPDYYVGRTEYDSPEVDPEVLVSKTRPLKRGEYVDVDITKALPFELIGTPADQPATQA